jgi:hypothetical protein
LDNGAASARPGSKLLVPFLNRWPPPFRFDYLKKHSRAPLSPFLASLNGYEVPAELYMSARQRQEMQHELAEQREHQGYPGPYPAQQGFLDPHAQARPSPHSLDPIERARARANTHTTYWRTVPTEGDEEQSKQGGLNRSLSDRGAAQPKSSRPEWNFRHHLKPPAPRVGQTTAKKAPGRRDRTQAQLQHQHQQQYMAGQPLPPLMQNGQPIMPPYFYYPNGQPMPFPPYGYVDPNQPQPPFESDPAHQQQQQQYDANQQYDMHQQQQQQYEDQQQQQQQQEQDPSQQAHSTASAPADAASPNAAPTASSPSDVHTPPPASTTSSSAAPASASTHAEPSHLPPTDGPTAPILNPNAGAHVKEIYTQLYQPDTTTTTTTIAAADTQDITPTQTAAQTTTDTMSTEEQQ